MKLHNIRTHILSTVTESHVCIKLKVIR